MLASPSETGDPREAGISGTAAVSHCEQIVSMTAAGTHRRRASWEEAQELGPPGGHLQRALPR